MASPENGDRMTNESHTDWWNQYLESDDPDHVVVQMDKEIELLRDQRDSNMAKEVERIASLTTQRDEYKVWWERDSTSLGKALNEVSSLRAVREESRAAIEQLHAAVKTAQELAATRLMEIEKLQMRLKRHEPVSLYNGHDIDWWKAEAERLRGAMQTIVSDGDYTAPEGMKRIAQAALSGSHEPREPLWPGCDQNGTGYHRPQNDIVCSDCGAVKSQGASRDASSPQRPSPPPATSRYCVVCDRIKDDSGETLGWALCECGSFRQPATTSRTSE